MPKLLRNNFFIAFLLLAAYLLLCPYIYGWDDQHLEVPILKHLIDPSLYRGDYYVESATRYFTCWLYPVLAKFITVKQIPPVYVVLFVISRYVTFYWIFRLWLLVSGGSIFKAVCATLMFFLLGRTDEFLYRSFCHEEFSFMFTFAGFYLFYRERYLAAAVLWGLGVNTHAIYNLFPMLYMLTFLLCCHKERFKLIFQTGAAFVITSLPFLCWQIPISISRELLHAVPVHDWMPLYLLSCPQNFLFGSTSAADVWGSLHGFLNGWAAYLLLIGLSAFQWAFNPEFRRDGKLHAIMGLSWFLIGIVYVFDYVWPHRFVLDLNLVRVEQYMRFFMMGYTTLWACRVFRDGKPWLGCAMSLLILSTATTNLIALFFLGITAFIFTLDHLAQSPAAARNKHLAMLACLAVLVWLIGWDLRFSKEVLVFAKRFMYVLPAMAALFAVVCIKPANLWLRRLLIILPLAGQFLICMSNNMDYYQLVKSGPGPWQLLRDWKDMQLYVRDHTPKDALILTPYDMIMGGFRIHSERKVLVCYRDCGIIGFDYQAGVEWRKRIKDIESFKTYTGDRVDDSVLRAILKYGVNYVVFMKYYGPPEDSGVLKKVYENEVFSLFRVS